MGKVYIETLGCKVNQVDSESIAASYLADGHEIAASAKDADICILNTCTVTAKADHQCRQMIRRMRKASPHAKIIVTGCYANIAKEELEKMPEVDCVECADNSRSLRAKRSNPASSLDCFGLPPRNDMLKKRSRPQLKIQDGCNNFCSYCIVPYARGRSRSVSPEKVIEQIEAIAKQGYNEVVLTGIHLGHYGLDLSPKMNLFELLSHLNDQRSTINDQRPRLRLSSIDPDDWSEDLIILVTTTKNICPHFHIPLQSGDDTILKAMGRRYTTEKYTGLVKKLKERLPDASIGADVIVGFPGETDELFENTRKFIESLPLTYLHVFPFSKRPGTKAAELKDDVPNREKQRRVTILRDITDKMKKSYFDSFIGRELKVIIEVKRDKTTGCYKGVSENYIPVQIEKACSGLVGVMVKRNLGDYIKGESI